VPKKKRTRPKTNRALEKAYIFTLVIGSRGNTPKLTRNGFAKYINRYDPIKRALRNCRRLRSCTAPQHDAINAHNMTIADKSPILNTSNERDKTRSTIQTIVLSPPL
jgi:hypothetical protein